MIYDLSNQFDTQRFKTRIENLLDKKTIVDLTEKKIRRTIQQNSYLHLILSWFSIETGNTLEYVKREYFKKLCNKDLFVIYKEDVFIGKVIDLKSSSELDSAQMTTAIDRFRTWSSQTAGIYLPSPGEVDFLNHIQIEIEKNKQYL